MGKIIIESQDVKRACKSSEFKYVLKIVKEGTSYSLKERTKKYLFEIVIVALIIAVTLLCLFIYWKRHILAIDKAWTVLGSIIAALITTIGGTILFQLKKEK